MHSAAHTSLHAVNLQSLETFIVTVAIATLTVINNKSQNIVYVIGVTEIVR